MMQRQTPQTIEVPQAQHTDKIIDMPIAAQDQVPKTVSQDKIQQRLVEQSSETPATSLAEMIVEVPVIQTPERTQQVVNTSVQHIVDTVEVEKPKIIDETVQKPTIQEKIN